MELDFDGHTFSSLLHYLVRMRRPNLLSHLHFIKREYCRLIEGILSDLAGSNLNDGWTDGACGMERRSAAP
jgi:hypothetical protein